MVKNRHMTFTFKNYKTVYPLPGGTQCECNVQNLKTSNKSVQTLSHWFVQNYSMSVQ